MLKIKCLRAMPPEIVDQLDAYSRAEWDSITDKDRARIFAVSAGVWLISKGTTPLVIIGVVKTSLIGTGAEVWFFCFKDMRKHVKEVLRFARKGRDRLKKCYGWLQTRADVGEVTNARFIEHFGFTPAGETAPYPDGKRYMLYELRG